MATLPQRICEKLFGANNVCDKADANSEAIAELQNNPQIVIDLCPSETPVDSGLTFLALQNHRRGHNGESDLVMRCDATPDCARINPAPLEPVIVFTGTGTLSQNLRLDSWSDDKWVEYAFRARVQQDAGTGWGFLTIPNIAGFQRPIITVDGTYRVGSTAVQIDEPSGQGGDGASPRGPFMGQEAHHWSSTQRIYMGYFRRDNPLDMYIDYRVKYVCL